MANYAWTTNFGGVQTTSVDAVNSTRFVGFGTVTSGLPNVTTTVGTVRINNLTASQSGNLTTATSGWLTGRRPVKGQQYPRGVYNK